MCANTHTDIVQMHRDSSVQNIARSITAGLEPAISGSVDRCLIQFGHATFRHDIHAHPCNPILMPAALDTNHGFKLYTLYVYVECPPVSATNGTHVMPYIFNFQFHARCVQNFAFRDAWHKRFGRVIARSKRCVLSTYWSIGYGCITCL